jgi:hypothetical protein
MPKPPLGGDRRPTFKGVNQPAKNRHPGLVPGAIQGLLVTGAFPHRRFCVDLRRQQQKALLSEIQKKSSQGLASSAATQVATGARPRESPHFLGLLDVSSGLMQLEQVPDQVHYASIGCGGSVSPCPCAGGLEQPVERIQPRVCGFVDNPTCVPSAAGAPAGGCPQFHRRISSKRGFRFFYSGW